MPAAFSRAKTPAETAHEAIDPPFTAFARSAASTAAPAVTAFSGADGGSVPSAADEDAVPGPGTALLDSIQAELDADADADGEAASEAEAAGAALPPVEVTTVAMDVPAAIEADRVAAADAAAAGAIVDPEPSSAGPAPQPVPRTALAWVDPASVALRTGTIRTSATAGSAVEPLLPASRRRLAPVIAPIATAGVLAVAYVAAAALWPLAEVAPTVNSVTVEAVPGPGLDPGWPDEGAAAIAAAGLTQTVAASSSDSVPMASITKLVTALMILERQPLEAGEEGPTYEFTWEDQQAYWGYVNRGESRLEAPSGTMVSQYQLLQGILIGSANNWTSRLVNEVFGSADEFAEAVPAWLAEHDLTTMTVVEPTGIDRDNTASPADITRLGELALGDPVIAEIISQREVELPGAGTVENTNPLIADDGVVGLKTGTYIGNWNLLVAREIRASDDELVTVVASVMGQPDADARNDAARQLLDDAAASLIPVVAVPAGTTVAQVSTEWGQSADYVTAEDSTLVMWNGDVAATSAETDDALGRLAGEQVGTLTTTGSFATTTATLELTNDVAGPSLWWRLTHPLDLLGLH